jgi:predicted O-methyltransferase YrrM
MSGLDGRAPSRSPSAAGDRTRWERVDDYLDHVLEVEDPVLAEALRAAEAAGLPAIQVSAQQGRLLQFLAQLQGARRILEIGTLGGYSAIWLGRALPPGGRMISLELEPRHAAVARENLARAGLSDRVEVRVGPAAESLAALASEHTAPFDLVFIDADKERYPEYLTGALRLSRAGTLLVADNVIRNGDVAESHHPDPRVQGVRRYFELLAANPGLATAAIQMVGAKGYDGWALARVLG